MTVRKSAAQTPNRPGLRMVRHGSFYVSLALGVVALVAGLLIVPRFAIGIGVNAMFVSYLVAIARKIPSLTQEHLRRHADEADTPVVFILVVVLAVVGVSFYGLFSALNGKDGPQVGAVVLSIVSVLLGWFVINTMAAMHYAYEFYESETANPKGDKVAGGNVVGGLEFPEGDHPDVLAFLYFSYVLGTAFAVSDIRVTSRKMRKIVIVHSVFSYFFNTLIVAATVNVAVAVGGS